MKIPITEAWGMLSNNENIAYIPNSKQIALVTPQYKDWLRNFDAQRPQEK